MAIGDKLIKYDYQTIIPNGRTASIDLSLYYNNATIQQSTYLKRMCIKNTTSNSVTINSPTFIVNGKSINYYMVEDVTIPPNTSRWIGYDGTGSFNEFYIASSTVIQMGSNIPQGLAFVNDATVWDNSNQINLSNVGAQFSISYNTIESRPTNLTVQGVANIYEDIVILGSLQQDTNFFGLIGRDLDYSTKPIRRYEGYKDRTIIKPGYFDTTGSKSIDIYGYKRLSGDTRSYGTSRETSITLNLVAIKPTITDLKMDSNILENPIRLSWIAENQTKVEIEARQSETVVYSNAMTTGNNFFTISANTIKNPLTTTFRVRVMKQGNIAWSDWREVSDTLEFNAPTISNLNTIGEYYEKDITVNFRSGYQTGYEYELYYNNEKIKNGSGGAEKEFTIPANTFTGTLNASVRVRVIRVVNGVTLYSNWQEKSISLKEIVPTVSELTLSGSNIDLDITFGWNSTDQQKCEVEAYKGDSKVVNYSGTTDKFKVIPHSTLTTGLHRFRVRIAFNDRWTEWQEITSTLIETLPSIGVLEPDGIITERDNPTRTWWTSQNQSKWQLTIDNTTTYTGTTEKEKILDAGALVTGSHSMILTVWYVTSLGVEKTPTIRKSEWIVQGKPPTPTITSIGEFTTNRPTFTWDTQEQQGYILEVLQGNKTIYSTDWQNGLVVSHKVAKYLANGTYTVRIKTMNQYGLESEWSSKGITIYAVESENIMLDSMMLENSVYLTWDNPNNTFIKFYIIRNGLVIGSTTDTTYTDYVAHLDCLYTIRGVDTKDAYKDSNMTYERVEITRAILSTVGDLQDQLRAAFFTSTDRFNTNLGLECKIIETSGREYPIAIFGKHSSKDISLKLLHCDSLDKLVEMFYRREVFCYRDAVEKIYFVIPKLPYNRDSLLTNFEGNITATVVDYSEGVNYD